MDENEAPPTPNSVNYEDQAGVFSLIFFGFVYPVIKAGHKRMLEWTDLWKIHACDSVAEVKENVFSGWELDKEKKKAEYVPPLLTHSLTHSLTRSDCIGSGWAVQRKDSAAVACSSSNPSRKTSSFVCFENH
jgi:hypothetical protein